MKLEVKMIGCSIEDEEEILSSLNGPKYRSLITDLLEWLRNQWKYDAGELPAEEAQKVADWIVESSKKWNIEL